MRDKLFDNLAEVDKSLRRSYIIQTAICLLFFYFSYNSIMVAGQKNDIDFKINNVESAISEYTHVNIIITELTGPNKGKYEKYRKELEKLADEAKPLKKEGLSQLQFEQQKSYEPGYFRAVDLENNAESIENALKVAKKHNTGDVLSKVSIEDITDLLKSLLPIYANTKKRIKQLVSDDPSNYNEKLFPHLLKKGGEVREFRELLTSDPDFLTHSSKDINDRIDLLARVKKQITEFNKVSPILDKHLKEFKTSLVEKKVKLNDTSIGSIQIPFTGQPLEINLAFRLGPIVILLFQLFISTLFRHRFELLSMINSTLDQSDPTDKKIKENIHLFLWPWILNYPYFRTGTIKIKKQRGDFLTKALITIVQFLPVFTIAFIAIRPITFGSAENPLGDEIAFGDVFGMSAYLLLFFLTIRQVLYSRCLDSKVSDILGWKSVVPVKAVVAKPESRLRRETIFVLLTLGALLLNFNFYLTDKFRLSFEVIPPLLIIITGLMYSKLRTNILTGIVVGCWMIIALLLVISGVVSFDDYLWSGLRGDVIVFPHASITGLVHLVLAGYFSVMFHRKTQSLLVEAGIPWEQISLPTPEASTGGFRKVVRFAVVVFLIIGANLMYQNLPWGLALLICIIGGCRLGPKQGALAGGVAVFLSWILSPVLYGFIPNIGMEYRQIGQIVTFALTGFLAGKGWLLIKQPDTLKEIGVKLLLLPKKEFSGKRIPFVFLLFMLALVSSLYIQISDSSEFVFLRFLLAPLPTVIVILLGVFYGPRKAAWSTGIILCLGTLVATTAVSFEINSFYKLSLPGDFLGEIGLNQWSLPVIAVWTLAAYVAGKINLVDNRRHLFWFAVAVFVFFQLPGFIKYGSILSVVTLRGHIEWFDLGLIASLLQLLEPWVVMLLVGFFTKGFAGNKSAQAATTGE